MPGWSDDEDRRLRALWDSGLTATLIGEQMRRGRNSVIGRAHRLELAGRANPTVRSVKPPVVEALAESPSELGRVRDLAGMRFGERIVLRRAPDVAKSRHARWLVLCDCGREDVVTSEAIRGLKATRMCSTCSRARNRPTRRLAEAAVVQASGAPATLPVPNVVQLPVPKREFSTQQTAFAPSYQAKPRQAEPQDKHSVRTCQFPLTDCRPWRFCGKPAVAGTSWCASCHARVFVQKRQATEAAA